ncbi:hypothetical protein PYCCODRAFT_1426543 [Trametes coccinea BRFM310]|uniref:Yeast cell wall synthesis Kre9/Knh1-like N-terminal domain-containing protein n=1 Tax=Trametes coccinea (strain BRFM310) TaxID=1353009 RepID=A0A1Y2IHA6_TRAC3|nr:hypothetical protein PYCCODRAFT_1426543 [Trametes coccinea BRFM310]
MFASAAVLLLAAASPALGNLFMTSPVASTTWAAGQQQTISWKDDGSAPSLADLGACKVSVYVGSQTQQTLVQSITDNVDVSTTSSIVFTPDASSGENGNYYFIRVESINFKDPNNSQYPAEAFSSKYTMSGMTGTFDATVKAQIGASGAASSVAATSSQAPATSAAVNKVVTTSSAAPSSSASAHAAASNGAASVSGSAIACVAGVAAIAYTMLF